ncbi:MAG: hypothetical protein AB8C84_07765 [Oligoflexales bacterium]
MCHFFKTQHCLVVIGIFSLFSCLPKNPKKDEKRLQPKDLALNSAESDILDPLNKSLIEEKSINLTDDQPAEIETSFPEEEEVIGNPSTDLPEHLKGESAEPQEVTITLPELYKQSNLVVRGKTQKIDYRVSTPNSDGFRAPLTFVNVKIQDVFKGRFSGREITLKFVGGPVGTVFSTSEQTPLFNLNDEDILFINGNGEFYTPVSHVGRVRIIDDNVFSELGTLVPSIQDGEFLPEEKVGNNGVTTKKVHDMIIEIVKSESIGENGNPIQRTSKDITAVEYEKFLKNLQSSSSLQLTDTEIEVSLNPNKDLNVPSF